MESSLWQFLTGLIVAVSPGIVIVIGISIWMIWDELVKRRKSKKNRAKADEILSGMTTFVSGRMITGNFSGYIDDYIDVDYTEIVDNPEITERT